MRTLQAFYGVGTSKEGPEDPRSKGPLEGKLELSFQDLGWIEETSRTLQTWVTRVRSLWARPGNGPEEVGPGDVWADRDEDVHFALLLWFRSRRVGGTWSRARGGKEKERHRNEQSVE